MKTSKYTKWTKLEKLNLIAPLEDKAKNSIYRNDTYMRRIEIQTCKCVVIRD